MSDNPKDSAIATTSNFSDNFIDECRILFLDDACLSKQVLELGNWAKTINHLLGFSNDSPQRYNWKLLNKACLILAVKRYFKVLRQVLHVIVARSCASLDRHKNVFRSICLMTDADNILSCLPLIGHLTI